MAYKDVSQTRGWKWRMLLMNGGIMAPYTTHCPALSAVVSNIAASAESATLAALNTARRGLLVFNDSNKDMYLKYGATASASSFSVKLAAGAYWEMPHPIYTGIVDAIWATGPTGAARVTELE